MTNTTRGMINHKTRAKTTNCASGFCNNRNMNVLIRQGKYTVIDGATICLRCAAKIKQPKYRPPPMVKRDTRKYDPETHLYTNQARCLYCEKPFESEFETKKYCNKLCKSRMKDKRRGLKLKALRIKERVTA